MINDKITRDDKQLSQMKDAIRNMTDLVSNFERKIENATSSIEDASSRDQPSSGYAALFKGDAPELFDAKSRYDQVIEAEATLFKMHTQLLELTQLLVGIKETTKQDVLDTCEIWENIRKQVE